MVGWEFKSSTYQRIHIKHIPRHEASIWTDWAVTADAATWGKYLPFPGTWWQLMIPLWQINVLVLQIKKTFKEVRPVTSAISNTKPNYDPTSADHTRLTTRTTGTAEDIGTFWKWKLLKSCDELLFTTVFKI